MRKARRHTYKSFPFILAGTLFIILGLGVLLTLLALLTSSDQKSIPAALSNTTAVAAIGENTPAKTGRYEYIEVIDSCGPYWNGGPCVNMRSGPGTNYPVVIRLRTGMVLKVATTTVANGHTWYKIGFDGEIHYPERVTSGWYVDADYVQLFSDDGEIQETKGGDTVSSKRIVVDLVGEMLYAYDGATLFMQQPISTGLELTPTLPGTFRVYKKIPDSYMQGPVPGLSSQYYDLPGVPWDLYFTNDGNAIHGSYWHDHFGKPWSHGCVNLPIEQAKILYKWADLGTPVIVRSL